MSRRLIAPAAAIALMATGLVGANNAANAAPRGAACQVSGKATISPGLTTTARAQKITLSGVRLANCLIGSSSAAGVPKTYRATVATSPNPVSNRSSCASGNLKLTATVTFNTGKKVVASISTTGLLANQALQGKITSSTEPALKAGDIVAGDVAFEPTTTAQNCVTKPVTAVTFQGAIGMGSPN